MVTVELIEEAARFLKGKLRHTPLEASPLSDVTGVTTWLKLESLQVTGSFKIRGAYFRLSRLTEEEKKSGVATCSAGNHGKAVAWAAKQVGVPVRIYVPGSVDASKYEGMRQMGATVVKADTVSYDEAEIFARKEARRLSLPFVSAFEDDAVMAGNGGTLAKEILEDLPEVENIVVPISGGGLAAGLSVWVRDKKPGVRIVACQHKDSPSFALSLERGEAVTRLPGIDTLAGGIEGGIGRTNFEILKDHVREAALLSEDELYRAVVWMLDHHQLLVEPSAAVTVAACLERRIDKLEGPTVVVLSGRNLSVQGLEKVLRDAGHGRT